MLLQQNIINVVMKDFSKAFDTMQPACLDAALQTIDIVDNI